MPPGSSSSRGLEADTCSSIGCSLSTSRTVSPGPAEAMACSRMRPRTLTGATYSAGPVDVCFTNLAQGYASNVAHRQSTRGANLSVEGDVPTQGTVARLPSSRVLAPGPRCSARECPADQPRSESDLDALGGWKTERMMRRYAAVTDATLRAAAEAVSGSESLASAARTATLPGNETVTPRP